MKAIHLIFIAALGCALPGVVLAQQPVAGKPHPGTEASLRRYIASLQKGVPNYDEMIAPMAEVVRRQLPQVLERIKPLGAVKSITFTGKSPQGDDIFEVVFEHGRARWFMAPLAADGKVQRRGFQVLP